MSDPEVVELLVGVIRARAEQWGSIDPAAVLRGEGMNGLGTREERQAAMTVGLADGRLVLDGRHLYPTLRPGKLVVLLSELGAADFIAR